MKIVVVLLASEDESPMADFLAANALRPQACWRVNAADLPAEPLLAALETAFHASPADLLLFPASVTSDELATRLAWRLQGSAVSQALSVDAAAQTVSKAAYGNALTATLQAPRRPLCLSVSPALPRLHAAFPVDIARTEITPTLTGSELPPPDILSKSVHPLQSARVVLATGQGAMDEAIDRLAQKLKAEIGLTRQRVMAGGCDEQRMLGISGQSIAPEVCLIAGASGASAFMAGVAQSRFIVAINTDPAAPVFAAADVGIVGEATEVLAALAACVSSGA